MREGEVRIIKADALNWGVQRAQWRNIGPKANKDREPYLDWVDVGYYGDKLEWAIRSALLHGAALDEVVSVDMLRRIIAEAMRDVKETTKHAK